MQWLGQVRSMRIFIYAKDKIRSDPHKQINEKKKKNYSFFLCNTHKTGYLFFYILTYIFSCHLFFHYFCLFYFFLKKKIYFLNFFFFYVRNFEIIYIKEMRENEDLNRLKSGVMAERTRAKSKREIEGRRIVILISDNSAGRKFN